jgi:tetratricopeptide (TPR) repeat protein
VKALSKKEKLLASAQKNLLKGQVAKAIKDYEKIVEIDKGDMRNRQKLGELYHRAGMSAEALDAYESVAKHYSKNGFYLKAIAAYKQMQKVDPTQSRIYFRLGELNEKQGLRGNALAEYRQLVQILRRQDKEGEAVKVLDTMKDLDPDNLKLRLELIAGYARKNEGEKGAESFQEMLEHLHSKKELTVAGPLLETLQSFFPDNAALKVATARLLVDCGDAAGGIELLREVLSGEPQHKEALTVLAEGHRLLGAFEEEKKIYQGLLAGDSGNLDLRERFVRSCLACENGQLAFDELEPWKEAFFDAQRAAVLKEFYEKLRDLLPENEQVRQTLRVIYEKTGEGGKLFDLLGDGEDTVETVAANGSETVVESKGAEPDEASSPPVDQSPREETNAPGEDAPAIAAGGSPGPEDTAALSGGDEIELEIELEIDEPSLSVEAFEADCIDFDTLDLGDPAGDPAPEVATPIEVDVAGELEEAEFFFQQGLLEEAADKCRKLLETAGECDGATQLLDKIRASKPDLGENGGKTPGARRKKADAAPADKSPPAAPASQDREKLRLDGSLNEFKKGLESQIEAEDTETHYNLGIAYKEMGLLDDAIEQFDKAKRDVERRVDCLTLKGACLVQKGDFETAVKSFREGLAVEDIKDEERISLYFELGLLYLGWERPLEALDSFQCVADIEPFFRQVDEQIRKLRKELGLDDGGGKGNSGKGSNKNRVSYI